MKRQLLYSSLVASFLIGLPTLPTTAFAQTEQLQSSTNNENVVTFEETKRETVTIPFETIRRENPSLAPGEEIVVQEGKNGERIEAVTYLVTGDQRQEKGRVITEEVPAQARIVEYGPSDNQESSTDVSSPESTSETKGTSETTTEKTGTTVDTTTESTQTEETTEETEETEESSEQTDSDSRKPKDKFPNTDTNPIYRPRPKGPAPWRDPYKLSEEGETQQDLILSGAKKQHTFVIERRLPTIRTERVNSQLAPGQMRVIQEGSEGVEYIKITVYKDRQGHSHIIEEVLGQKPPIERIVEVSDDLLNHRLLMSQTQQNIPEVLQFFYQRSSIVDRIFTSWNFILNGPRIYSKPYLLPMTGEKSIILYHPYFGWTSVVSGLLVLMRKV